MARIELRLFQHFALLIDEQLDQRVSSPRLHALLAWLVFHRQGPQSRERLATDLWPDSPDIQARTNLRNLLFRLRSVAPSLEAQLQSGDGTLQWRPNHTCHVDVIDFEEAAEQAEHPAKLKAAIALYTGPVLPSCHDEWLEPQRQRLALLYEQLLTRAIGIFEQGRDITTAIETAEKLLAFNPLREDAYRALMRLHAVNGDRATALRIYRQCAETLEQELGVYPSEPTRDIARRLRKETLSITRPAHLPPKLIGRQTEWSQLQSLWQKASGGQLSLAILEGEAGTGKTRLAEEMQAWAQRQSIAFSFAKCYPTTQQLAYGTTISLLKSCPLESLPDIWQVELYPLMPERLKPRQLPAPDRHEPFVRHRLMEAISRAICLQQPRLVVIDDAQWCDPDTIDWLAALASHQPDVRLMVLMTICTEELAAEHPLVNLLHALQRAGRLARLTVGPLTQTESLALVEQTRAQGLPSEQASWVLERSAGNPLLLIELLKAGLPSPSEVAETRLPTTIQTVFERRLSRLSPTARTVAELAAVMGDSCSTQRLESLKNIEPEAVIDGTEELWGRGILLEDPQGRLSFSHGLFGDFLYRQMSTLRRRSRHLQVADSLAHRELKTLADQLALGRHLDLGGRPDQALTAFVRAGQRALSVHAYEQAQHCFQHALTLSPLQQQDADHHAALVGLEATSQILGHLSVQTETLQALQALAESRHNPVWLADVYTRYSRKSRLHGDNLSALSHADKAAQFAATVGDKAAEANARIEHAMAVLHDTGDVPGMMADLSRAYILAVDLDNRAMQGLVQARMAWCMHRLGQLTEANQLVQEALNTARSVGDGAEIARVLLHQSRILQTQTEWRQAARALEEARALAADCGHTTLLSAILGDLGKVSTRLNQLFLALEYLKEAMRLLLPYPYDWVRNSYRQHVAVALWMLGEVKMATAMFDLNRSLPRKFDAAEDYHVVINQAWLSAIFGCWDYCLSLVKSLDLNIPDLPPSAMNFSQRSRAALELVVKVRTGQVDARPEHFLSLLDPGMLLDTFLDFRDCLTVLLDCLVVAGETREAIQVAERLAPGLEDDTLGMLAPQRACLLAGQVLLRAGQQEGGQRLLDRHQMLQLALERSRTGNHLPKVLQEVEALFLNQEAAEFQRTATETDPASPPASRHRNLSLRVAR